MRAESGQTAARHRQHFSQDDPDVLNTQVSRWLPLPGQHLDLPGAQGVVDGSVNLGLGPERVRVLDTQRAGLPGTITLNGTTVVSMLGMIQGSRIDDDTYVTEVGLTEDDRPAARRDRRDGPVGLDGGAQP